MQSSLNKIIVIIGFCLTLLVYHSFDVGSDFEKIFNPRKAENIGYIHYLWSGFGKNKLKLSPKDSIIKKVLTEYSKDFYTLLSESGKLKTQNKLSQISEKRGSSPILYIIAALFALAILSNNYARHIEKKKDVSEIR